MSNTNLHPRVIVISTDGDFTVQIVTDWMSVKGACVDRLVLTDDNISFPICVKGFDSILALEKDTDLKACDRIWLHRSRRIITTQKNSFRNRITHFQKQEIRMLYDYVLNELPEKLFVVPPVKVDVNKLLVLKKAKSLGMVIPHTIVTNSKNEVYKFLDEHGASIIKPLSNCFSVVHKKQTYSMFTSILDKELIDKQEDLLFPIMIQERIEKKYDIRTFFLNGSMYSMAIFSQLDSSTRTDWRISQQRNSIRNVPYLLPEKIQDAVRSLMNELELKTGSIDFILSKTDEYVFLEVNPVGQFGMVSELCNYSLYNKFADFVIGNEEQGLEK